VGQTALARHVVLAEHLVDDEKKKFDGERFRSGQSNGR
jgi:hypothetical protein